MTAKKPAAAKIDLFKELLPALDRGDKNFYNNLTPEQQKTFSPWLIMRWASSVAGSNAPSRLIMINDFINAKFSSISKEHNELHWKSMAVIASVSTNGSRSKHQFIKPGRKKGKNKIQEKLAELYPDAKNDELELLEQLHSDEEFVDLCKSSGMDDKSIKELLK